MTEKQRHYDLITIGSGATAFAAAIEARQQGASVAMIERNTVGGTCVNTGCVPSKMLLRAASTYRHSLDHPYSGISTSGDTTDLEQLVAQKERLTAGMRRDKYDSLIDEYGWDLIVGEARFLGSNRLQVGSQIVSSDAILIATGARPAVPQINGLADIHYLTSTTAMELSTLPKSLLIIGAGYVGLEQGQIFHDLGSDVTLVQRGERLLPKYEPDVSEVMMQNLSRKGFSVRTGTRIESVERGKNGYQASLVQNGIQETFEADAVLVATGRQPNVEALELDRGGVTVDDRGAPVVDEYLRTTNGRIWAAGDVTLAPQFVYVAAYQGRLAARNVLNGPSEKVDHRFVPGVIFAEPQVATVGLTRAEAERAGYNVKFSSLPVNVIPRAMVDYQTDGVLTMVASADTSQILGVQMVGSNAGDVIYSATLAVQYGMTVTDLVNSFAPYLTMAEGLKLAALSFTRDVNKLSCCAA